jgi:hypothetical protein
VIVDVELVAARHCTRPGEQVQQVQFPTTAVINRSNNTSGYSLPQAGMIIGMLRRSLAISISRDAANS